MQLNVLLFSAKANIPMTEALVDVVLGIAIIFLVLAALIGIIYLMKLVFNLLGKIKKKEKSVAETSKEVEPEPVNNEEEIAAVIGAVLSLYYDSASGSNKKAPFIVKNIYKIK